MTSGTDWTDRRRPVWSRYEEWRKQGIPLSTDDDEWMEETCNLLHDLAAVLRAGAEWAEETHRTPARIAQIWQERARDPETGERVFPTGEEQPR